MRALPLFFTLGLIACSGDEGKDTAPAASVDADDADGDGVAAEDDCDDDNSALGDIADDADCDGTLTADDCDDNDAASSTLATDADCDGTLTADDCDDNDAASNTRATDADCDGVLTADDCDDNDATLGDITLDADCDGTVDPPWPAVNDLGTAADYGFVGEEGDQSGWSVSSAGDVDGDGLADLLVGARYAGKTYLILGASLGASNTIDLSTADYTFIGEAPEDYAGGSVSSAGDVDGDGLSDLLVGATGNDEGGNAAGKTYLILGASLGASNTIDLSAADYSFVGRTGEFSGGSVSSAGDVDGDGLDDLLLGAQSGGVSAVGKTYLVLGASLGASSTIDLHTAADYRFFGEATRDYSGVSVSSAGDVDGDGLDDILVGAYRNDEGGDSAGKVYLILGASLGASNTIDLSAADYAFVGEAEGDEAGWSVSGAGDVDGDGLDDLLIGANEGPDGAGKAHLVLGASLGASSTIDLSAADYVLVGEERDRAGWSVSSAGDVDGDGLADLLVGANEGVNYDGKAYLILGASLGASSTINLSAAGFAFVGEAESDSAGVSVSSAGDVDGDGLDDLLVGAALNGEGGRAAGKTYLILSAFTPPTP